MSIAFYVKWHPGKMWIQTDLVYWDMTTVIDTKHRT